MNAREKIALDMGDMMIRIRELEAQLEAAVSERDWLRADAAARAATPAPTPTPNPLDKVRMFDPSGEPIHR